MLRSLFRAGLGSLFALMAVASSARGQAEPVHAHEQGDDDHHAHLHFSHPLVAESPSPDTKIRIDFVWSRVGAGDERVTETGVRVEGEYAFSSALSLAVTMPYVWRSAAGVSDVSGVGNTEVSLKGASLRWGAQGVLIGGGLSVGLPTGSDARGIGTSRTVDLEPFVDVGLKRGRTELVGFVHYGTTVRNPADAEREQELAFDGSLLRPLAPAVEALVELSTSRSWEADETGSETSIAPGMKLYPFTNRQLMFGVSVPIGVAGEHSDARGVVLSGFYHF